MATHDYIISNASGAAVRADLNNALAAIATNNSSATAPTTTYAYQWWADTGSSPTVMKLRNAANSAWITLFQLDGEWSLIPFENGTAAAPSIYFKDSGTDTGLFSGGTDQVNITTGGTERVEWGTSEVVFNDSGANYDFRIEGDTNANLFFVDASADAVGIGSNAPSSVLDIQAAQGVAKLTSTTGTNSVYFLASNTGGNAYFGRDNSAGTAFKTAYAVGVWNEANNPLVFGTNDLQRAQIDASGRLLVGTSSSSASARAVFQGNSFAGSQPGIIYLQRDTSSTGLTAGNAMGYIIFGDNAGANYAAIGCEADGSTGTNDYPARLVFSTTADGASSPTERMRLINSGYLKVSNTGVYETTTSVIHEITSDQTSTSTILLKGTAASFAANVLVLKATRAATTAYGFAAGESGDGADREFILRGDGNNFTDGSWTGGGADYAEYFEWSDGNPDEEDRRGISVVLDENQIRPAIDGEDPIGVISGNPSMVGDAAWNKWTGKHLRDDYGRYILDENGERQLSPDYDPAQEYISREQRPEWDCVGLMGKLRIRKGQPTGSRWIKMRDISDSVEEWLVR